MNRILKRNLELFYALLALNEEIAMSLTNHKDKIGLLETGEYWRKLLEEHRSNYPDKFKSSTIKDVIDSFLFFWNESFSLKTERFWVEVEKRGLNVKRKKSLLNILERGRFLDIHEVISAREQWDELLSSEFIQKQFSKNEIEILKKIMLNDELKRVELFKKCLRNNRVPFREILKFSENMAYFSKFNIYEKYFTTDEMDNIVRLSR